jgi:hypothetical protein
MDDAPEDTDDAPLKFPATRDECRDGVRPCPWVRCRMHLYLDVNPRTGGMKLNFPHIEPDRLDKLEQTCALDVVDQEDAVTLERAGELLNLTRERVRQIEFAGQRKIRRGLRIIDDTFED